LYFLWAIQILVFKLIYLLFYTKLLFKKAKKIDASFPVNLDILLDEYYTKKDNYEIADKYFIKAIKIGEENTFHLELKDSYYNYSESLFE